jgi:ppGpp synthetase/RelA/SpoT-type nucleotidyltranferase
MNNDELSRQFEAKKRIFENLETEALYIIRAALQQTDIKLHSTTSRIKKFQSFMDKVEGQQSKKPFDEIHDIVGLRVTCLFLSDIDRIGEVIRESFLVVTEDNKIEGTEVSSFGYMSVHFIAMMKKEYSGPRYDQIANMPFEIQVRTIAMDAWANVSHYLDYKSEADVPSDLRRDFYALSGLFYVADKHFEMFFRSRDESKVKMAEAFAASSPPLDQEINLDSLAAYLENKFPDRTHSTAKDLSDLIAELSAAGFRFISEIDRDVERASAAFELYEEERPPSVPSKRFADVGVIRSILILTNSEFEKVRQKKYQLFENLAQYRELVR